MVHRLRPSAGKDAPFICVNYSVYLEGKCCPFPPSSECVNFTSVLVVPALRFVHVVHTIAKQRAQELRIWALESVI